jgi:hypothetical protein
MAYSPFAGAIVTSIQDPLQVTFGYFLILLGAALTN